MQRRKDRRDDTLLQEGKYRNHLPMPVEQYIANLRDRFQQVDAAYQADVIDREASTQGLAKLRAVITFYRQKVHETQTHKLTADMITAARAYTTTDLDTTDPAAPVLQRSRKDGALQEHGLSDRHCRCWCRASVRSGWATRAQRGGTHPLALKVAGGWASLRMVERYAQANAIANDEVVLG